MPLLNRENLQQYVGQSIGTSSWVEMPQSRIDAFADCTEDRQFIHVDANAAKETETNGDGKTAERNTARRGNPREIAAGKGERAQKPRRRCGPGRSQAGEQLPPLLAFVEAAPRPDGTHLDRQATDDLLASQPR